MEIGVHLGLEIKIALVITICAALIIGLSFAFYMVAKISLALVLMIGVFFMGCLLFPSTRQYGMNWIGQCLNHIITCTMFVLLTKVQMAVFDKTVNTALNGGVLDYVAVEMLPPVFLLQTIIFVIIVFNIPSIASALTGGAAVQGASRHLMSLARAPEVVEAIKTAGYDVVSHGWRWLHYQNMDIETERQHMQQHRQAGGLIAAQHAAGPDHGAGDGNPGRDGPGRGRLHLREV